MLPYPPRASRTVFSLPRSGRGVVVLFYSAHPPAILHIAPAPPPDPAVADTLAQRPAAPATSSPRLFCRYSMLRAVHAALARSGSVARPSAMPPPPVSPDPPANTGRPDADRTYMHLHAG